MGEWNILIGWCGMLLGATLGMLIGLRAESRRWAGGYDSFRRQALRLGHIAAFALGIINVLYGQCVDRLAVLPGWAMQVGPWAMIAGGLLMPAVCLASAWQRRWRVLFPVPATCIAAALAIQAWGWACCVKSGG